MSIRARLFIALAFLMLLPLGAAAAGKKADPAKKPPAPEDTAFKNLRHVYARRDFSNIWSLLSERDRQIGGDSSVRFLLAALKWSRSVKEAASDADKALAADIVRICGDPKPEDLVKLAVAKRVAMLYTIRDRQRQIDQKPPTGCARILLEKTILVAKVVRGAECTFLVENRWKYRRKRSEVVLVREGGTWRFRKVFLHVVGPHALGEKGLTVSKKKKKELLAAVRRMIAPPKKDPPEKNPKDTVDKNEIREIGPLAVRVAISFVANPKAKKRHRRNAVLVLAVLGEEAALAIPQLEKMYHARERSSQRIAAGLFVTLKRAGVPVLLKTLVGKWLDTASRGAATLGRLGAAGVLPRVVVPALVRALQRDPDLQIHALAALVRYHERRLALRPIAGMLKDKEPNVRAAAAMVLKTAPFRNEAVAVLDDLRAALKVETNEHATKAMKFTIRVLETLVKKNAPKGKAETGAK